MAASRSSSRSRRSARKGPRGRKLSNVRVGDVDRAIKKAELRRVEAEADLTRARAEGARAVTKRENKRENNHNQHIAADGSRQPGLNAPTREELRSLTDAVLDETLEKKLAELRSLVSRMEAIAGSPFQKPHLETLAECDMPLAPRTRGRAVNLGECLAVAGDAPKDRGLVDGAGARVRRLINIVEHIRAIVGAKGELLFGASPSESKGTALDKTSSAAGVHALFSGLDHLDIQVECLEHEVVSLLGQL